MNERVIERLKATDCYPGTPQSVRIFQTHLSVVCLAGDFAYKLKKPVRLPFVDFSTAELREQFCHEEVRLNRRLCPDTYLGVVPLYAGPDGVTFNADEGGEIVDHAVHMQRLPQDRMLNELLAGDEVSPEDMRRLARIMVAFHSRAERGGEVSVAGDPAHLQRFAMENFSETRDIRGTVFDPELHGILEQYTRDDFEVLLPTLKRRAENGRVVDGHGDLHARNICLTDPPLIYDCLEFSAGFRCADVATENAFLVMDLIYRGHRELAQAYLEAYVEASGDDEQLELMPVLVRYRAMVRAKVSAIAAGEHEIEADDREAALASARRHLNLAACSAIAEQGPLIILACGLPATGKSFVFGELARQASWRLIASDKVRKELAGTAQTDALPEEYYREPFTRRTYRELLRRAADNEAGVPALLDANFRSAALRQAAVEAGRRRLARVFVVWFRAGDGVIHERMAQRSGDAMAVSDADLAVYEKLSTGFEPPQANEGFGLMEVDGSAPWGETVTRILTALLKGPE